MLGALREARDRLKHTAQNRARPSGGYAPWEQAVNDWQAIWHVLEHPTLSITQCRGASLAPLGDCTQNQPRYTYAARESRAFALLDSAIAICRQRGLSLWPYLVAVITACRQGHPARPLPQPIG